METTLYAKVDLSTLEQAKVVLNKLGIPMSYAIDMFLRQVVIQGGMPFAAGAGERSGAETDSADKNRICSADETEEILRKLYRIPFESKTPVKL